MLPRFPVPFHVSILAVWVALFSAVEGRGEVRLPAIFSPHAVLQRSAATVVWGWAAPGEEVRVTLGKVSATVTANAAGKWKVSLDLAQVEEGPWALTVTGRQPNGVSVLGMEDVLVGEVWMSSGQSNMQFTLNATTGGAAEMARAENPNLRWFLPAKTKPGYLPPQEALEGRWVVSSPETAGDCSGVAYYFGKKLQADLDAPVGLVLTAVGGTTIQAWMSDEALSSEPELQRVRDEARAKLANGKKRKPRPEMAPSFFYNQLIYPLAGLTLRGVIWYQGEAHFNEGEFYRRAFPALIRDWRRMWQQPELPFYYCQLPNLDVKTPDPAMEGWVAGLREAQDSGLQEPQTGEAILIDAGGVDLHPPQKEIVGERLARLAEAGTYGRAVAAQSPRFASMDVVGGRLRIRFKSGAGGLAVRDLAKGTTPNVPESVVQGFAICGEDQRWHWARAEIDGDSVIVWSPEVTRPTAVRYAWGNNPTCNLYDQDELPAAPFRATVSQKAAESRGKDAAPNR